MDDSLRAHALEVRRALRQRTLSHGAFADALMAVPFVDRDVWVDEVIGLGEPPDDGADLPQGAVPYVPCGVDAIVHAVRDGPVTKGDVFVDLGAGLGRVAMLVHLMTGARALGLELQAHLVERGRIAASALALRDVQLTIGDAAAHVLPEGTVYFIYASFSPAVLRAVLSSLETRASTRRFVVCAVGFEVHDQPWLSVRASSSPELTLYDAAGGGTRARCSTSSARLRD